MKMNSPIKRSAGFITALIILLFNAGSYRGGPPMNHLPKGGIYINAEGSPLLPLLANATGKIDIEVYTMKSQTVRDLIRGAINRGVIVRVILEPKPLGEKCNPFSSTAISGAEAASCSDLQSLVREVRSAGGVFKPFNKANLCPNGGGISGTECFQHGKIALADGITLISTGNFDSTNLCIAEEKPRKCNRDYTLIDENPEVFSTLTKIFEADLRGESYDIETLIPPSLKEYLTVSPDSLGPITDFIKSARTSIDLEDQYLKDRDMNAAIIAAANRGVRIKVTVENPCAFGKPSASEMKKIKATYSAFDQAGIETRMFSASNLINGRPGYMHAKAIVVDNDRVWIGSENGSTKSLTQNREFGVVIQGNNYVNPILATVKTDHDSPHSKTWQESLKCAQDWN